MPTQTIKLIGGNNTAYGIAQSNNGAGADRSANETARRLRSNVEEYYRTRLGLYDNYAGGTVGYEYGVGNTIINGLGQNGTGYGSGNGMGYGYGAAGFGSGAGYGNGGSSNDFGVNGFVSNDMDTNAILASDHTSSTQVSDPKSPSGLVRSGTDNID